MIDRPAMDHGTALWVGLLVAASALTTLALACATPFASLAAIAATRLRPRAGFMLIVLTWAVSQMIGFGLLNYPRNPTTFGWGTAMLTAACAATGAARWGSDAVETRGPLLRLTTAFGTGFVAYKATLLAWSFALGGVHIAASPYWTAHQLAREAVILSGLVALYHALVAMGAPAPVRERMA